MKRYFEKIIIFCNLTAKVNCDGKCKLAKGIGNGTDGKPETPDNFPEKWCVRECDRCNLSEPGKWELPLPLMEICND